jgi:hypothetical protein
LNTEIESVVQFIDTLHQASQQRHSEKFSGKLFAIATKNTSALPLIESRLSELKAGPDFSAMAGFLCASGLAHEQVFRPYFSAAVQESSTIFFRALDSAGHHLQAGIESSCASDLMRAMDHACSNHDRWVVMRRSGLYFNKIGQHRRAQACALESYHIAQYLGDESLQQTSRFSVLNSTRLKGHFDVSSQYAQHYKSFTQGKLFYSDLNQYLIPIYAALHLMDLSQDNKMIRGLLGASNECIPDEYTRLNNKLAWARYNHLRGRVHQARTQVRELTEEFDLSSIDIPVMGPLLSLANELGIEVKNLELPSITPASWKQWRQFDLAFDSFCTQTEESHDRRDEGIA